MLVCIPRPARFRQSWRVVTVVVGLVAGCSPGSAGRGTIQGRVTLDGKPLEVGAIALEPLPGVEGVVTGGPIRDGAYALTGKSAAKVGRYRVVITARPTPTGKTRFDPTLSPECQLQPVLRGIVAPRYNTETTLTVDIQAGDNTADFAVESEDQTPRR